jgi:ketosteroid isomerase-like protein
VVLEVFKTVEDRDTARFAELCDPECELHWPPSLPYGGVDRDIGPDEQRAFNWGRTWAPLQPTERERSLSPRVVAASDAEVVVHWLQRGVCTDGERIESPVLGLYRVRQGKLLRAQMFYFDPVAVGRFLEHAVDSRSRGSS